ncbi:GAF domain-containing protein [Cohnella sp. AR92]|uniref:GAF domain-containing protein n=1 Tax=Cohnella sp. AR92 TaxID=648716 RepID=UPI000F8DBD46|nr:GAF domain-containing protein [Cohnella sp. AR92]RUS44930.1 GAF domain-containing protein [Cohnella sp. AR92]
MAEQPRDTAEEMIGNGSYNPMLETARETGLKRGLKWVVNFVFALIHFIVNIPVLLITLVGAGETVYKWVWDPDYSTHVNWHWILYVWVGWILFYHLVRKTMHNMVSKEVELIWAANFIGKIKNRFYSFEYAQQATTKLEEYVDAQMKERERELIRMITVLEDTVKRLDEASDFPLEVIQSLTRIVGFFSEAVLLRNTQNPRYSFENVMDHLISEMTCIEQLHGLVHQASIMLVDSSNSNLRIVGSYNLHENVRRTRVIPIGERFAGKVVQQGNVVWLNDLTSDEAQLYGYNPEHAKSLPYAAVMGHPIHVIGDAYIPIGVIVLHFKDKPTFTEYERSYITNTIILYAQMITAFMRLIPEHQFLHFNRYLGGAEHEAAAASQTSAVEE